MSIYVNVLVILLLIKYSLNHWPNIEQAKIQKIFLVVSSIILALFTGLRDQKTGADTLGYGTTFLTLRKYGDFWKAVELRAKNGEYGYGFWNRFWGGITGNVNVYFTVTAAVFAVCLAIYIYKNSQNPFFSMILYVCTELFGFQMTGMRQAMAMAILLISIEFIKERKLICFLITVYIASLFHNSALAFMPAYFISYLKMDFKAFASYMLGLIFFSVYGEKASNLLFSVNENYSYYEIATGVTDNMGGQAVIGMLLLTLVLCFIFKERVLLDKHNLLFLNLTIVSLLIYILRYFSRAFERVSFYYQFAFIILLPNVIEAIPDDKTRKIVYTCAIVLACALFFYRYQIKPSYYGFLWKY